MLHATSCYEGYTFQVDKLMFPAADQQHKGHDCLFSEISIHSAYHGRTNSSTRSIIDHSFSIFLSVSPSSPSALHCVVTDPVTAGPSPHQRPSLPKDARPIKKPKRHNDTKANREVRSPSTRTPNDSIREAERCIHKLQTGFGQLAPQMLATTSGLNQLKDPWPA